MGSSEARAVGRRRLVAMGVLVGVLAGTAVGAALLTRAGPEPPGPSPIVLHAGPALVPAGRPVALTAATYCRTPSAPSCTVTRAEAVVRPAGAGGWIAVPGRLERGAWAFELDATNVPRDGFAYWLRFTTGAGGTTVYPPGGEGSPIRVLTLTGLPVADPVTIEWGDRAGSDRTLVRLRPGVADDRVGFSGRGSDTGLLGPSSFDVAPDGGLVVADWVHERLQTFDRHGRLAAVAPLPVRRPVDVAVAAQGFALTTLGTAATAFEVGLDGEVRGRYPVAFGVASRVVVGNGPRVRVGNAQWIPVRSLPGAPLRPSAQAAAQTAAPPSAGGVIGLSQDVGSRVAFVWTRPDGSRGGAVLPLAAGVRPGADYFVRPLADGGALAARGVWDATHFGVLLVRFDATGTLAAASLLPAPTPRMAAPYSTVRFLSDNAVAVAVDDGRGIRIDRFSVR